MKARNYWITAIAALAVASGHAKSVFAQSFQVCGDFAHIPGTYGPADYRTAGDYNRMIVEGAHFTPPIEMLQKPKPNASFGADIGYTLYVFPNHPRALLAMMKLAAREKKEQPVGATYTVGCYFDRAIRFAPDDPGVRIVYALYLIDKRDPGAAREQLEVAREKAGDSANLNYNLGLAYFDLKDYELARDYAKRAYDLGFPLEGLKKKLKQIGQWQD